MIRWFRRKCPAPAPPPQVRISPQDRMIARWWGFTPQQWAALPPAVQIEKRDLVIWSLPAHDITPNPPRGNQ